MRPLDQYQCQVLCIFGVVYVDGSVLLDRMDLVLRVVMADSMGTGGTRAQNLPRSEGEERPPSGRPNPRARAAASEWESSFLVHEKKGIGSKRGELPSGIPTFSLPRVW